MKIVNITELLNTGNVVRIGKNQVYKHEELYVVEKYELTDHNGKDLFSIHDGYLDMNEAFRIATII